MAKRYRLTGRAQMHGTVREPGYEFMLEEGERGPMKTLIHGHDVVDVAHDNTRLLGQYEDVPIYEAVDGCAG